jgi:Na+/H+ antiporter NhaC
MFGSLVAVVLMVGQRILALSKAVYVWLEGVKSLLEPTFVLIFAWTVGGALNDLQAANYIASGLAGSLTAGIMPFIAFMLAGLISLSTGTSWGTMAILFPLVMPLANEVSGGDHDTLIQSMSSILAGSVLGDHISPISDTNILSAISSGCPLNDHVWTQTPYALCVVAVSLVFGNLFAGYKVYPAWVGFFICAVILTVVVFVFGRRAEDNDEDGCTACRRKLNKLRNAPPQEDQVDLLLADDNR